jgi:hypothetical protein
MKRRAENPIDGSLVLGGWGDRNTVILVSQGLVHKDSFQEAFEQRTTKSFLEGSPRNGRGYLGVLSTKSSAKRMFVGCTVDFLILVVVYVLLVGSSPVVINPF